MNVISYQNALIGTLSDDFEFDGLSFKIKEAFKSEGIILKSNFSFGNGDGIPPELPRLQLNDDLGVYRVVVSLIRVDFHIECPDTSVSYDDFIKLVIKIKEILESMSFHPVRFGVVASTLIKSDNPQGVIKKELLNPDNPFFEGHFHTASVTVADLPVFKGNMRLNRMTNVFNSYRIIGENKFESYVSFVRDINNIVLEDMDVFEHLEDILVFCKNEVSEKSIELVINKG